MKKNIQIFSLTFVYNFWEVRSPAALPDEPPLSNTLYDVIY